MIDEGDWVLVYDNSLDNQDKMKRKFARRCFRQYVVTSPNDNATYNLSELDGSRFVIPLRGKE